MFKSANKRKRGYKKSLLLLLLTEIIKNKNLKLQSSNRVFYIVDLKSRV